MQRQKQGLSFQGKQGALTGRSYLADPRGVGVGECGILGPGTKGNRARGRERRRNLAEERWQAGSGRFSLSERGPDQAARRAL